MLLTIFAFILHSATLLHPIWRQCLHSDTFLHPIWRQNAVDTTLGKKWQRWIVLKRTAIVAIFC